VLVIAAATLLGSSRKAAAIDPELPRPGEPAPQEVRQRRPCAVAAAINNDRKIHGSIVTACNSRDAAFGR
jgi:hypothetical protein